MTYYSATKEKNTLHNHVPAPYVRKSFIVDDLNKKYTLKISVVGIYTLTINGVTIDKGYLLPFRTNPDHIVYVDEYDVSPYLEVGENVIGVILGNGFSNCAFESWDFDKLRWAHSPKIALEVYSENKLLFDASSFKTHPSEYLFDDFYLGEHIDASKLIKGWNLKGFDDSHWNGMIEVSSPEGELLPYPNFYTKCYEEVKPIKVIKSKVGYVFDFGASFSMMYKIKIKGEKGKRIKLFMNDAIFEDGSTFVDSIAQLINNLKVPLDYYYDWLILSGEEDTFINHFSYKAGRYLYLEGLSDEEAKNIEITLYKISSITELKGHFKCDNEIINKLQEMTVNSDISNFVMYPTDCPQREKNGWTGDTTLSSEQFLLNLNCKDILKEWLKNIVKAQNKEGTIPGIVPTDTWGFAWGNGPAWDMVMFEASYRSYIYTGDKEILEIVHKPIIRYLEYMKTKEDENGLYHYGLDDWLPIKTHTPLHITNTIECKHICDLAKEIFSILGDEENAKNAQEYSEHIRQNYLKSVPIDYDSSHYSQAQGAMSIYYDMYDEKDLPIAKEALLRTIAFSNYYIDFGVCGNRAFWRTLGDLGYIDLAIKMMIQDGNFSFKKWVDQGGTTLFEKFNDYDSLEHLPLDLKESYYSHNHHFWGDISAFFYRYLAGIRIDQYQKLNFAPVFSKYIHYVKADSNDIEVEISGDDNVHEITLFVPDNFEATLTIPNGYYSSINSLNSGLNKFKIIKK